MSKELEKLKAIADEMQERIELSKQYYALPARSGLRSMFFEKHKKSAHYMGQPYKRQSQWKSCIAFIRAITDKDISDMRERYLQLLPPEITIGTHCRLTQQKVYSVMLTEYLRKRKNAIQSAKNSRTGLQKTKNIKEPIMMFEDEKNIPESKHRYVAVSGAYGSHPVGGGSFEMME